MTNTTAPRTLEKQQAYHRKIEAAGPDELRAMAQRIAARSNTLMNHSGAARLLGRWRGRANSLDMETDTSAMRNGLRRLVDDICHTMAEALP